MWGNLWGWLISAAMLTGTAGALYMMARPPQESSPAGLVPLAFKPVSLPVSADTVRPHPTKDCDAGDLYQEAITTYLADPTAYDAAARVDVSKVPAVAFVVQAADCGQMHLFEKNPKQAINYDGKKPWIDALMALGQATTNAGLHMKAAGKKDEARRYYEAAFELGRKMFEERVAWPEMNIGLSIMTMATDAMARMADEDHDAARVDLMQAFQEPVQHYHEDIRDKVAVPLGNPVESYASKYAGDVFAVAKNPAVDRVWRVEAILHIGHYRWNVADDRKGDQIWAMQELQKLDKSIDPKSQDVAIKTAVQAAENLTLEQQRFTGSGQ